MKAVTAAIEGLPGVDPASINVDFPGRSASFAIASGDYSDNVVLKALADAGDRFANSTVQ